MPFPQASWKRGAESLKEPEAREDQSKMSSDHDRNSALMNFTALVIACIRLAQDQVNSHFSSGVGRGS